MSAFPFLMNNVLLTRRCNLSCNYCRIIRDYEGMPYQEVESYQEVEPEKWIEFGKWIKDNTDGFLILYGGEPFVYEGLKEILEGYNDYNVAYTVITNATKRKEALQLVKKGILKGLSTSVDPTIFDVSDDKSRVLKSNKGFELLVDAKEIDPTVDAVAEIVVDNSNYKYLKKLVDSLSSRDIWSSITIIESSKNKYYDFAEDCDSLLLNEEQRKEVRHIIETLVKEGKKVHTPEAIYHTLDYYDQKCDLDTVYHTSTIEPNGDLRLCLRIKGDNEISKFNIFDLIQQGLTPNDVNELINQAVKENMESYCEGCSWTCVRMHLAGLDEIKHAEEA